MQLEKKQDVSLDSFNIASWCALEMARPHLKQKRQLDLGQTGVGTRLQVVVYGVV